MAGCRVTSCKGDAVPSSFEAGTLQKIQIIHERLSVPGGMQFGATDALARAFRAPGTGRGAVGIGIRILLLLGLLIFGFCWTVSCPFCPWGLSCLQGRLSER